MTGKLTIGYPPPDHDSGYQPILDGSRPGAAQQSVERDAEDLPRRCPGGRVARPTHVTTSARWSEALYTATNAPLQVLEADPPPAVRLIWAAIQSRTPSATQAAMRPVSVGVTVTGAGHALARTPAGWVEIPDPGRPNREDPG